MKKGRDRRTNECFAIKIVRKSSLSEATLQNEINMLRDMNRECEDDDSKEDDGRRYAVLLHDVFEGPRSWCIVTELGDNDHNNTDLPGRIARMSLYSERNARDICRGLLRAVRFLHEKHNIAHRDLKPENLLLVNTVSSVILWNLRLIVAYCVYHIFH